MNQVPERRCQSFPAPGLRKKAAYLETGQFAGNLAFAIDGNKNDVDAGIDLLDPFRQPDAAVWIIPKLDLCQQHVTAMGFGKRQSGIGTVEAMQLRIRNDLRQFQLHDLKRVYVHVHMDDLNKKTFFPFAVT